MTKAANSGLCQVIWSGKRDSNSRPQPWQGCALPAELFPLKEARILAGTADLSSYQRQSSEGEPDNFGHAARRYSIMLQSVIKTARYSRTYPMV